MLGRLEASKKWQSILNVVLIVALMVVPWRVASGVGLTHVLTTGHIAKQLPKAVSIMHKSGSTIVSIMDGLKNSSPDYYQKLVDDGRNISAEYNTSDLNSSLTDAEITPEDGFAMQVYLHNLVNDRTTGGLHPLSISGYVTAFGIIVGFCAIYGGC